MLKHWKLLLAAIVFAVVGGLVWLVRWEGQIRNEDTLADITITIRGGRSEGENEFFRAVLNSEERIAHALSQAVLLRCDDDALLRLIVNQATEPFDPDFAEDIAITASENSECTQASLAELEGLTG